jgi:hypothetical protein
MRKMEEQITAQERGLESLRVAFDKLFRELRSQKPVAVVEQPASDPGTSLDVVQCVMKKANSLEGIIACLTRRAGGNVRKEGIVTITAKSRRSRTHPEIVADLTASFAFCSDDGEPGQWICWDFRPMRVRPTHYTIVGSDMKSSVVDGSLDGRTWIEIDRRRHNQDFHRLPELRYWHCAATFAVFEAGGRSFHPTDSH